jgi:hypothetical protein
MATATPNDAAQLIEQWRETRQSYRAGPIILPRVMDCGSQLADALHASMAMLRELAETSPWATDQGGDSICLFCGIMSIEVVHRDDCLWQRAEKLK